jgi:thioredoxin-like negative regulator of GroEL
MEFLRFNAPDANALAKSMGETRLQFEQACASADALGTVEHAADLASMLTTARREEEALSRLAGSGMPTQPHFNMRADEQRPTRYSQRR